MKKYIKDKEDTIVDVAFTLIEVAAYTGYKESYIYKLVHLRKIPARKQPYGRKLFFKKSEIDSWLFSIKLLTVDEIADTKKTN